jgi:hypothetical protein
MLATQHFIQHRIVPFQMAILEKRNDSNAVFLFFSLPDNVKMTSETAEAKTPPLGLCIGSDWNDHRESNPPSILSSTLSIPLPGNGQHSSRASEPRVEEQEKIASPRSDTPSRYIVTPRGGFHDTHSTGDDAVDKVSI